MIRRSFRLGLWLGLLFGIGAAVYKVVQGRRPAPAPFPAYRPPAPPPPPRPAATPEPVAVPEPPAVVTPEPEPEPERGPEVAQPPPEAAPAPAAKKVAKKTAKAAKAAKKAAPAKRAARVEPWVNPEGGICPTTHPVKAKMGSGIFHVPGGLNYDRTVPDRCYASPEAAEGDGLRGARR